MFFKKVSKENTFSSKKSLYFLKANSFYIIPLSFGFILVTFALAYNISKAGSVTLKTPAFELHAEKEAKPK
jgi:hypothetical protein